MRRFYTEVIGVPELASGADPRGWAFYGNGAFTFSLNEAAYTPASDGWTRCPMNPAIGDNWRPYMTFYVASLDERGRARLRERLRERLPVAPDGAIPLTARAWGVRGVRV
jgi:hypothetical protein